MKIHFVNHASFIVENQNIKLICDPWLEGPAFDNGWKHLAPTQMKYEDFNEITHIWFSHEHPDHFSPPNLLKIPSEIRAKICILYQQTIDRKVIDFCKKIGFGEFCELKQNTFTEIGNNFRILCNAYTYGDSYALIDVEGFKILNLNDCIVDTEKKAEEIFNTLGEVDVLFTQFSYANKVGNENDIKLRENVALLKLKRIEYQNIYLKPKVIIPFASFVYFCHEENKYMNFGINNIQNVFDFITNSLKSNCVVLYPGDVFMPTENHDSETALSKYAKHYSSIENYDYVKSMSINESELIEASIAFVNKLKEGYPHKIKYIESLNTKIYLTDINRTFILSGRTGLCSTHVKLNNCDLSLSSNALSYCFRELWGFDTLTINARYQILGNIKKFSKFGSIAASLNRKEDFPVPTIREWILKKIKKKLKSF